MIRCGGCGRLWPQGTKWCGHCRATLGARYCEEGHESPLDARCCLECGSPKLTRAVERRNLRPVTWVGLFAAGGVLVWAAFPLFVALGHALQWLVAAFLSILCILAAFTVAIGGILGPKTSRAIGRLWLSLLNLLTTALKFIARGIGTILTGKRD